MPRMIIASQLTSFDRQCIGLNCWRVAANLPSAMGPDLLVLGLILLLLWSAKQLPLAAEELARIMQEQGPMNEKEAHDMAFLLSMALLIVLNSSAPCKSSIIPTQTRSSAGSSRRGS
jgi:hypothetical protein